MRDRQASHFEIPTWDALTLLRSSDIGRLCVIDHGTPVALPVNYRVVVRDNQTHIVVRAGATSLLGRYEGPASFEVDRVETGLQRAWSVVARGTLRRVQRDITLPDPEPWVAGDRHQWLALLVDSMSARRFTAAPVAGGFAVEWSVVEQPSAWAP